MTIEDAIRNRIESLISEASPLQATGESGKASSGQQTAEARGWIAATFNVLELVCPSPDHAYCREAKRIVTDKDLQGAYIPSAVRALGALLQRLHQDIEDGLLASVANHARAEVFDDFLDHGEQYLNANRKDEAGVIAGIVFEDTVRRICRSHRISERGVKLDHLISELAKKELLSGVKAKRARAAADLRTSASHAQWDEFETDDVRPAIQLTRELISKHLDA